MNGDNPIDTSNYIKEEVSDKMEDDNGTSNVTISSSRKSSVMLSNYRLQTHVTVKKFKELYLAGELNDNILTPKLKTICKDNNINNSKKLSSNIKQECNIKGMIKLPSRKKFQIGAQDKFEMAKFIAGSIHFNSLAFNMTTNSCFVHNEKSEECLKFIIPFIPSQQTHTLPRIDDDNNEIFEIEIKLPHSFVGRIYPDSTKIKINLFSNINSDWISLIEDSEELIEFKKHHHEEVYQHYLKEIRDALSTVHTIEFTLMKAHMVWMNYLIKTSFSFLQRALNMEANNKNEVKKFLKNNLYGYSPARRVTKSVTKFAGLPVSYNNEQHIQEFQQQYETENCFNVKITKNNDITEDGKHYRICIENNNSYINVTYQGMITFAELKHIDGIPLKIRFEDVQYF
uniref:ZU5 domain-containing protein n=1 Tax=Strongyloides stercoralis TaxID=6248 RepID=A0A0K0EPY8_STRER